MAPPRRLKTGSVAGAIHDIQSASQPIQWPITAVTPAADPAVQARVLEVFNGFISTRARDDWRPSDVLLAARCARIAILIDEETVALEAEGTIQHIGGRTGTQPVRNPRCDVLSALHAQATSAFRALSLFGSPVDKRLIAAAAKAENQARSVIQRAQEADALL